MNRITQHPLLIGCLACFVLTIVSAGYVLPHLGTPLGRGHEDSYYVGFLLNHYWQTVDDGDWKNILNEPMGHGLNDMLLTNEPYVVPALIGYPIYKLVGDPIVAYELLALTLLFCSLVAMYWFVYTLAGRVWVSVLASTIFVFHPFFTARQFDHFNLVSLFFIPLIFGLAYRYCSKPSAKTGLLFFLCLTGQLVTSFYYSVYLLMILPIYLIWVGFLFRMPIRKILNWSTIVGTFLFTMVLGLELYAYRILWMPGYVVYTPTAILQEFWPWGFRLFSDRSAQRDLRAGETGGGGDLAEYCELYCRRRTLFILGYCPAHIGHRRIFYSQNSTSETVSHYVDDVTVCLTHSVIRAVCPLH